MNFCVHYLLKTKVFCENNSIFLSNFLHEFHKAYDQSQIRHQMVSFLTERDRGTYFRYKEQHIVS